MPDSPTVQTIMGNAGNGPEIHWNGRTYRVGHPTQRAKAELERLCVARATAEVLGLKGTVEPAHYAELFDAHRLDITSGAFKTWGPSWQRIAFAAQNAHLFLLSLLRQHQPDATETDAKLLAAHCRDEVELALAQVVPGFFQMLLDDLPAPPETKARLREQLTAVLAKFASLTPPTRAG